MLTAEQKEIRQTGIGGSDAPIVCNQSNYMTAVELYFQKTRPLEIEEALPAKELVRSGIYWGDVLEPELIKAYALDRGCEVEIKKETFRSKRYPWMICHIDGIVTGEKPIIVEAKNRHFFVSLKCGEEETDEIANDILIQGAHIAIVMDDHFPGIEKVEFPMYFGGGEFKIFTYTRNEKLESNLIEVEEKFWNEHVLKGIPPEPRFYSDCSKIWPNSNDSVITASSEAMEFLDSYRAAKMKIKELKDAEEKYKVEITKLLGDASVLVDAEGNKLATWKTGKTSRTFRLA